MKIIGIIFCAVFVGGFAVAQSWTQTSAPTKSWSSIAMSADGTRMIAVAGGSPIYLSTNSGVTWATNLPANEWNSVATSADGTKLVAVISRDNPLAFVSTNSGASWTSNSVGGMPGVAVASSADGGKLFLLTAGFFYISTNSGTTWTSLPHVGALNGNSLIAVSADGTRLAVAFSSDGIYTSTNSGNSWISNNAGAPFPDWSSIASSVDGRRLAAGIGGNGGSIYISTNSGATWTTNAVPRQVWTSIASSADGSKLIAAANNNGTIFTSTNSGATWVSNNVPKLFWRSVAMSADGNTLAAVAFSGGIWTLQTTPVPQLHLAPSGNNLAFSWLVPSTNFVLQQNADLTTTNWVVLTNMPTLNLSNLQEQVFLSPTNGSAFFRLISQ